MNEQRCQPVAPPVSLIDFEAELAAGWVKAKTRATNRGDLTLFEPIADGGTTLVVKTCPGWDQAQVRRLVATTTACCRHAQSHGVPPFVATATSWGVNPDYVCSEWIAGTSVEEWLAEELRDLSSSAAVKRTLGFASAMAELMAHFHAATSEHTNPEARHVGSKSDRVVELLAGPSAVQSARRVRTIDDPGPHNTIRDPSGQLWLIDLPADDEVVVLERDLARLISRIVGSVHRHSTATWVQYSPVVEAVIAGYRGSIAGDVEVNRSVIYACLAADAGTKAVLTRRRLPPGTRLECFVRESAAAVVLSASALRVRLSRHA